MISQRAIRDAIRIFSSLSDILRHGVLACVLGYNGCLSAISAYGAVAIVTTTPGSSFVWNLYLGPPAPALESWAWGHICLRHFSLTLGYDAVIFALGAGVIMLYRSWLFIALGFFVPSILAIYTTARSYDTLKSIIFPLLSWSLECG